MKNLSQAREREEEEEEDETWHNCKAHESELK